MDKYSLVMWKLKVSLLLCLTMSCLAHPLELPTDNRVPESTRY